MKSTTKLNRTGVLSLTLLALLACSSCGFAQVKTKPGHPAGTVTKAHKQNNNPDIVPMRKAMRELRIAQRFLRGALPIYEGKREAAIDDTHESIKQIALGIGWNLKNDKEESAAAPAKAQSKVAASYTEDQREKSRRKLIEAAKALERAEKILTPIAGEYGGHRVSALKDIDKALADIKAALKDGDGGRPGVKKP